MPLFANRPSLTVTGYLPLGKLWSLRGPRVALPAMAGCGVALAPVVFYFPPSGVAVSFPLSLPIQGPGNVGEVPSCSFFLFYDARMRRRQPSYQCPLWALRSESCLIGGSVGGRYEARLGNTFSRDLVFLNASLPHACAVSLALSIRRCFRFSRKKCSCRMYQTSIRDVSRRFKC